jgi:FkbM family methyltransferase
MQQTESTTNPAALRLEPASSRVLMARRVSLVLALLVCFLLALFVGPQGRRVRFGLTGTVRAEGLTLLLDPKDKVITPFILDHGAYEPAETAVFRSLLRPGETFIDVGANIGWYTVLASRIVGPKGRVIAFEPAPGSFDLLRRNAELNGCRNVILEPKALSKEPGTLRLHLDDVNRGHHSILKLPELKRTIEVPAVRLDDYLKDDDHAISLIKIDTEGAEGFVLAGMAETLRRHPRMAIILEFFPRLLRLSGYEPEAFLRQFVELGYEIEVIEASSGKLVPIHSARIESVTDLLDERDEYVNLLIKRP